MLLIAKTEIDKLSIKEQIVHYEYEVFLFVFLLLRFAFKNILDYANYFTKQPIFALSDTLNTIVGSLVLILLCAFLASVFGRLIRSNEPTYEKPILILAALFFACPASLPFLFNTANLSGSQMLYPFALFVFAISIAGKPIVKWIVPAVCFLFFVPAFHSSEMFFSALHKGSILYVPLIILFLFLQMMKESLKTGKGKILPEKQAIVLLATTVITSVISYVYSYIGGYRWGEAFGGSKQNFDLYLLLALLIISPVLAVFGTVLYKAKKDKFPKAVLGIFWRSQFLLLPLFAHNYTGLWVPYFIISITMLIFYSVKMKNPAMLVAVKSVGEYFLERRFAFYIVLIVMASLTNVTSSSLSNTAKSIFSMLPY